MLFIICKIDVSSQVSSTECLLKNTIEFGYNTELARAVHTRESRGSSQVGPYRSQTPNYTCGPNLMPLNLPLSYRTPPISDYQQKASYLPSFNGDYSEDALDYTLPSTTYPLCGSENVGEPSNYSSQGMSRVWIPGTQSAKGSSNGAYFDSETAAYGPSQMHYNNQAFGFRSSVSSEPNHFSFSSMASSLPTPSPITVNDRILPIPSRINPVLAPLHRSADDLGYSANAIKAIGGHTLAASQLMTAGHSTSMNYLSHVGNHDSVNPYNSNGLAGSLSQQQSDMYSSSGNWAPASLTTDPGLRSQDSSSDLYYCHGSDGSRKASQGGQSSISSTMSNGQVYQVPYHQERSQAPRSGSMDISNGANHHRSSASLRAA
jgi:hypothetical protein